jgi:prenyltransferase beta subunit
MLFSKSFLVCGLVLLVPGQQGQIPRNIQETIEYVQLLQTPSGGFLVRVPPKGQKAQPSLRATSAAIRALKYFGGKVKDVKGAKDFIARCHDAETGGFADTPGSKADVFTTAVGLMVVAELKLPLEKYRDGAVKYLEDKAKGFEDIRIAAAGLESVKAKTAKANDWIKEVRKQENSDGSFGKGAARARLTGASVVTILRLGGSLDNAAKALDAIKAGQQENGGFGSGKNEDETDLNSSYQIMRAFHMLKAMPDRAEALRTYVEKCRNEDGGYSVTPNDEGTPNSTVTGTYFAAVIHHWLKES